MRRIVCVLLLMLGSLPGLEGTAVAAARRMFVTSVSGDARLGDWADAGSATGLAAGDAICQALADASLPTPGTFVAWLSDDTDDAYCRVHGLSGKVSGNCGQGSLPEAAGPWVRTDGSPFSEGVPVLFPPDSRVYLPPQLDEEGATIHSAAWTGTVSDGTAADDFDCGEWTDNTGIEPHGIVGSTDRVGGDWGVGGLGRCDAAAHLYCFETGAGDPLPSFADWGRLAFLTSAKGTGKLSTWPEAGGQSGLQAGDAICLNLAIAAALPHPFNFKAWLSTATIDARDRFVIDYQTWMRIDRARISSDMADLTDGYLHTAINLTETGDYVDVGKVWTGTDSSGVASATRCAAWTTELISAGGIFGEAQAANGDWSSSGNLACNELAHLYCLQDMEILFADGFESGDTTVWSSAFP